MKFLRNPLILVCLFLTSSFLFATPSFGQAPSPDGQGDQASDEPDANEGFLVPWYSPWHPDYSKYTPKGKRFADFIRANKELLKLEKFVENFPKTAASGGAGGVLVDGGILGVSIGPMFIVVDLLNDLHEKDQEDWDGDGIPNGEENRPDVYEPTGVIDAGLNVLLQTGPNNNIDKAVDNFKVALVLSSLDWYAWWND